MSYFKRLCTVVMTLALLTSLVLPAAAYGSNYQEITVSQAIFPNVYDEECYLKFIPTADGWYGFYSISTNMDPRAKLWNDDMELFDDDSGGNWEFMIKAQLKAGEVYYLRASWDSDPNQNLVIQVTPLTQPENLVLNETSIIGYVGEYYELTVTTEPLTAINEDVSWSSSHPDVASVDEYGYVSLVGVGTATVTATSESGLTATCDVTVQDTQPLLCGEPVVVTQKNVRFRFVPEKDGWYCFYSTDATGDPYCEVLDECMDWLDANGDGPNGLNFKVTVRLMAGNVYYLQTHDVFDASFTVHVNEAVAATALLLPEHVTGEIHNLLYLQPEFVPFYARQEAVTWNSSDETVAAVNEYGEVTLVSHGTAIITATSANGLTATCTVTVRGTEALVCGEPVVLEDGASRWFSFTPECDGWYRFRSEGEGTDPMGSIYNEDRSEQLAYGDDDEGLHFSADYEMEAGKTYLFHVDFYHFHDDGWCSVVLEQLIPATTLSLTATQITSEMYRYEHVDAIFEPSNAIHEEITWTSSDEDVVQVHNGDLWMFNPGTVTITATTESGLSATCTVTVREPGVLVCDQVVICGTESSNQTFRFVPEEDGTYGFYTTGNLDTNLELYGEDNEYWWDDDGGDKWNALLVAELVAGKTYYLSAAPITAKESYTVQVTKLLEATQIILDTESLVIYEDCEAYAGDMQVLPFPAVVSGLVWTSSDEAVVTVNTNGDVIARKPGTAVITVTTESGLTDSIDVTVLSAPKGVDDFGSCGANLLYTCTDGVLTITGTGDMWDYWYYPNCHQVTLPQGLTGISSYAFEGSQMESLDIPATVKIIQARAFAWSDLKQVRFLGSTPVMEAGIFEDLTLTAYYPAGDPSWTQEVMGNYNGDVTWVAYSPEGTQMGSLTGSVTTFSEGDTLLELLLGDQVVASATVSGKTGSYELQNIPVGSYTLRLTKDGHVTRSYAVTVDGAAALDVKLHLPGDITGDGRVNVADTSKVYAHAKGASLIEDEYLLACADIDSNGKINVADTSKIYAHARGSKLLW